MKILDQFIIHSDPRYHCGMPSAIVLPDGEVLVAFRHAPDHRLAGTKSITHIDIESIIMLTRSSDSGVTWSEPEIIFQHPDGGCQDPCLHLAPNGTILCTSYGWQQIDLQNLSDVKHKTVSGNYAAFGGFIIASEDKGRSWQFSISAPRLYHNQMQDPHGDILPAFNRGALANAKNNDILWGVTTHRSAEPSLGAIDLLASKDGIHWNRISTIASEPDVSFNENSLYLTPHGEICSFVRSISANDHAFLCRSSDGGRTFSPPHDLGWQGHPLQAMRLSDQRVMLVYGYRHSPFGIRARLLDPECTNAAEAEEFIIRDDGGSWDIGYPWAILLPNGKAMVIYYFNIDDGPRHIAASLLQV